MDLYSMPSPRCKSSQTGSKCAIRKEHLIITIDLEGEKKYLDQKKLYYCPIQRRIGLYVPQRKLILWSTGLCSVKLELIKIGQIRRFFNILTDALKKSLEAKTFRLWSWSNYYFNMVGSLFVLHKY